MNTDNETISKMIDDGNLPGLIRAMATGDSAFNPVLKDILPDLEKFMTDMDSRKVMEKYGPGVMMICGAIEVMAKTYQITIMEAKKKTRPPGGVVH